MSEKLRHVSCAGGLIVIQDRIVVIERGNGYAIPKGHVEKGDKKDLARTARREVREETGRDAEIIRHLGQYSRQSTEHSGERVLKDIDIFLMHQINETIGPMDEVACVVPFRKALDAMHFQEEADFLAEHAAEITGNEFAAAS